MSQAPSMPVFTDALLGDTLHLSAEEFGAYCLLLFATWRNNGKALPEDDRKMARICRVTVRRWRERLRPSLHGFFDTADGTWHQKRLEKEWRFVAQHASISRSNGAKGGRPMLLKDNNPHNPAGSVEITQKVTTHTQSHKEEDSEASLLPPDPVRELWDRGKKIVNASLLGKMRKLHGDAVVMEAIVACESELPADPASFLVACCSRSPPRNGHAKSSPVDKLYEGAYRAAQAFNARHGLDSLDGEPSPVPLLDGGRSH